jgi:MoaA/NifB/PqqE/SkfB family radical SAM enzyme
MIIENFVSNLKRFYRDVHKFVDPLKKANKTPSETFCVLPFNHLHITPNGTVKICCYAGQNISKKGSSLSIYNVTYEEIWNSQYMADVRRSIAKGLRVKACERCYHEEKVFGTSRRVYMNEYWASQGSPSPQEICNTAKQLNWKVKARPIFLQLNMGNLCNLACRMCSSEYSSRISRDPVHSKWVPAPYISDSEITRFDKVGGWWSQKELMLGEILCEPREVRRIIFQGGEPLIIKEFGKILDYLIEEGAGDNVIIELTTNTTKVSGNLIDKLRRFKRVDLGYSIDGIGEVLEYIRYPAKWDKIQANLKKFSSMENINHSFAVAVQAYNLMTITDLYRYCDENNILVCAHFLVGPAYLHVLVLPISARKIALERLKSYINGLPAPANIASAQYLVNFLEQNSDVHRIEQIRPFMLFTNDMDVSRNQRFSETYPELVELFGGAGFPWIEETYYTNPENPQKSAGLLNKIKFYKQKFRLSNRFNRGIQ